MIGFVLCLLAGQFLFHVPLRGSLSLLCLASMVYLMVALGIGLLVSTLVKSQFLASQLAMLLTFLPAMMLSGFLYDLRSMPGGSSGRSPMCCRRDMRSRCCRPFIWRATSAV